MCGFMVLWFGFNGFMVYGFNNYWINTYRIPELPIGVRSRSDAINTIYGVFIETINTIYGFNENSAIVQIYLIQCAERTQRTYTRAGKADGTHLLVLRTVDHFEVRTMKRRLPSGGPSGKCRLFRSLFEKWSHLLCIIATAHLVELRASMLNKAKLTGARLVGVYVPVPLQRWVSHFMLVRRVIVGVYRSATVPWYVPHDDRVVWQFRIFSDLQSHNSSEGTSTDSAPRGSFEYCGHLARSVGFRGGPCQKSQARVQYSTAQCLVCVSTHPCQNPRHRQDVLVARLIAVSVSVSDRAVWARSMMETETVPRKLCR